jgi:hypothetical protein
MIVRKVTGDLIRIEKTNRAIHWSERHEAVWRVSNIINTVYPLFKREE